jgi:hypothetical protein
MGMTLPLSLPRFAAAAAVTLTALAPASALAAGVHSHPKLAGSPQMRLVDAHHADLRFASDRLPRTANGRVDAKITFAGGLRVSNLRPTGIHGSDIVYTARISSAKVLKNHQKFQVTFRLGDSSPVKRSVKLFLPGEHG